jgi:hypothetical protein
MTNAERQPGRYGASGDGKFGVCRLLNKTTPPGGAVV